MYDTILCPFFTGLNNNLHNSVSKCLVRVNKCLLSVSMCLVSVSKCLVRVSKCLVSVSVYIEFLTCMYVGKLNIQKYQCF